MQNSDKTSVFGSLEMRCATNCEENEQFVVFKLVVPVAAKVPSLSQPVAVAKIVQPASITTTVAGQILTQLRANNTALSPAWCTTATLAVTRDPARPSSRY